jgi:hypothetical protein
MVYPLKLAMILLRRCSHEYIELGLNIEYHASASPSATITMAKTVSFPPAEAKTHDELAHV